MTNDNAQSRKTTGYIVIAILAVAVIAGFILFLRQQDRDEQAMTNVSEQNEDQALAPTGDNDQDEQTSAPSESIAPTSLTETPATSTEQPSTTDKTFTAAEVAKHADASSCYAIVGGNVFDLTSWINQHPGGARAILGLCGTDGTAAFTKQHGSNEKAQKALASFKIGVLK